MATRIRGSRAFRFAIPALAAVTLAAAAHAADPVATWQAPRTEHGHPDPLTPGILAGTREQERATAASR